jgi:hypothetical protein
LKLTLEELPKKIKNVKIEIGGSFEKEELHNIC